MSIWKSMKRFLTMSCVTLWLASCGGGIEIDSASFFASGAKTGKLKLYLETNPVYFMSGETMVLSFYEIMLSLKQVQVYHQKSKKWIDVPLTSTFNGKPVDFKKYADTQNQDHLLAENVVPAGHYNQVKIIFDQNQPEQDPKNYLRDKTETTDGELHPVNYVSGIADGFIIPASIDVAADGNAQLGLTMDLRSLFAMIDRTYTYKPVLSAVDLTKAGNIELDLAANNGNVLVSAQRNKKIIRSMYAPAAGGKILLTQLPKTSGLNDTYQVVLSSSTTALKVIINVPVKGGGQTTSLNTAAPIVLVPGDMLEVTIQPRKFATSEVMGAMGAEAILNVQLSADFKLPVVATYSLSSVSRLVPDSDPDYLLQYTTFVYPRTLAQVAYYRALPIEFQAYPYSDDFYNYEFVLDPDLNSRFIYGAPP